jgi:hypothetical protein
VADFTVLVLKVAFLAILWLFIILIAVVVNADMLGRRQKKAPPAATARPAPAQPRPKPDKKRRGQPWVLAIDSGLQAGDRLQLVPEVHIGRSEGCELVLDDDYVSQTHARLNHRSDGVWILEDLGSTNGTFVNAERITVPTIVGVDDVIRIGEVQMRLEV